MTTKDIALQIMQLAGYLYEREIQRDKDREVLKGQFKLIKSDSQNKQSICLPTQEVNELKYKNKTIKKRADGRWWSRYYKNGKQYSVYGKTQQECLKNLKKALNKNYKNTTSQTYKQWLDKWIELYKNKNVKKSTLTLINRYVKDLEPISNKQISKITTIELQEFINNIDKSRKREQLYVLIKDSFNKAYKNKIIKEDPCDNLIKPKHTKKTTEPLTTEEQKTFIEVCSQHIHGDFFLICLFQGLRLGECLALTYEDINLEKDTINIDKAINVFNEITSPKTKQSIRKIPLFKSTKKLIKPNQKGKIFKFTRKYAMKMMSQICKSITH